MRKPVPPATFGTPLGATRYDLLRLRDHCQDLLDWIDDQSGGDSGSVTEITTGTPGVVTITNPTGPIVNIDVAVPAAGVTSLASSDPRIVVSAPTGAVSVSLATTVGTVRNPILDVPTTPHALNDEFDGGSPDLATRGWTVWNNTDNVTMVRVGDIDLLDGTLTSGQYRSTLKSSCIVLQFPQAGATSRNIYIYKAASGSARYALRALRSWTSANGSYKSLDLTLSDTAANPFYAGSTRYRQVGVEMAGGTPTVDIYHLAVTNGSVPYNDNTPVNGIFGTWGSNIVKPYGPPDVFTMDTGGGLSPPDMAEGWNSEHPGFSVTGGAMYGDAFAGSPYVRVGIVYNYVSDASNNHPWMISSNLLWLDFFRRLPVYAHWAIV